MRDSERYSVVWSDDAELALLRHKKFINVKLAYRNSFSQLDRDPYKQKEGVIDYPGFKFNGYYWTNINNAIVFYRVDDVSRTVYIDGCDSALTLEALKKYYGEYDPWEEE